MHERLGDIRSQILFSPDGAPSRPRSKDRQRVPVHEISFKDADGYVITEQDVLKRELKKLGLYGKSFAYSAFPPNRLDIILQTGTFHRQDRPRKDEIDCCILDPPGKEKGIRDNDEYDLVHYMTVANRDSRFATFAVYDLDQLETLKYIDRETGEVTDVGHPYYQFKDLQRKRKALLAVIKVVDFWAG